MHAWLYEDDIWYVIVFAIYNIVKKRLRYSCIWKQLTSYVQIQRRVKKGNAMRRFQTFSIFYVGILVIDHLESIFVIWRYLQI